MTHGRVGRVAALVVFAACSKSDSRATDSAAPLAAQNLTAAQRAPGPGELTKPLADYTGEELYALVQSLQYTGDSTRGRRCKDLPGCAGVSPTRDTRLSVSAVVGEDSVVPANVPRYGVIVSRGRNLGGAPDAMYGMRPGNRFQYYLVVLPGTPGSADARWQIEQLEVVGNTRTHSPLTTGTFRGCGHSWQSGGAVASFQTCEAEAQARQASTSVLQGGDPPWWVRCSAGCCVSETQTM